ncbi:MAG: hypothetical protein IKL32_06215 [Alphaproteobacteria bacterium]|nr:hypothetical protein [Alphaproteobacteria bacterium]
MEDIQTAVDKVAYLYPTPKYPEQKTDWDIGHKCLAYFEQQLPLSRMLLPWYMKHKLHRCFCKMSAEIHQTRESIEDVVKAMELGSEQLGKLRDEKKSLFNDVAMPHLIKKYKVANCQELTDVAYRWMTKQGKKCYSVECGFSDGEGNDLKCSHILLLYRNDNAVQSSTQIMADLNHPNVRALDMLFGRCGRAYDILNELAMESVCMIDAEQTRPLKQGDVLNLWNQNLANEKDLTCLNTYNVGVVQSDLLKRKKLVLYDKPQNVALDNDMISFFVDRIGMFMERQ